MIRALSSAGAVKSWRFVHHIGEMASELVHIGAQVMADGGTIDAFIQAVYNYPSLADSYKYAAYDGLGNWQKWQAANPSP